jgi:hypothetical protein
MLTKMKKYEIMMNLHPLQVYEIAINNNPNIHSFWKYAFIFLSFSVLIFAIFIEIKPNAVQKLPDVENINAITLAGKS